MKLIFNYIAGLATICSLLLSLMLGAYAISNQSGHSALDIYREPLYLQILALIVSLISLGLDWFKIRQFSKISIANLISSLGGVLFIIFLDVTGLLLEYNSWIRSGMPPHSIPSTFILVVGYLTLLVGIIVVLFLPKEVKLKLYKILTEEK